MLPVAAACCLLAAGWQALQAQDVDLRPKTESVLIEADVHRDVLAMRDGGTRIFYEPPEGWSPVPIAATHIELRPGAVGRAVVSITAKPGASTLTTENLAAWFRQLLPAEAEIGEPIDPPKKMTSISGAPLYLCTARYRLADEDMTGSVLFLCYQHARFEFAVTSLTPEHDGLLKNLIGSIYTWYWEDDSHLRPSLIKEKQNPNETGAETGT